MSYKIKEHTITPEKETWVIRYMSDKPVCTICSENKGTIKTVYDNILGHEIARWGVGVPVEKCYSLVRVDAAIDLEKLIGMFIPDDETAAYADKK